MRREIFFVLYCKISPHISGHKEVNREATIVEYNGGFNSLFYIKQ